MSRDFQINIIYYLLLLCPPVYLHSQNNNLYENEHFINEIYRVEFTDFKFYYLEEKADILPLKFLYKNIDLLVYLRKKPYFNDMKTALGIAIEEPYFWKFELLEKAKKCEPKALVYRIPLWKIKTFIFSNSDTIKKKYIFLKDNNTFIIKKRWYWGRRKCNKVLDRVWQDYENKMTIENASCYRFYKPFFFNSNKNRYAIIKKIEKSRYYILYKKEVDKWIEEEKIYLDEGKSIR